MKKCTTQMLKLSLVYFVLAGSSGFAQQSLLDGNSDSSSSKTTKQPKVYKLDFEDELVDGGSQKPDIFYLIQRKNINFRKLVRLRENFLPEMKETSESLLEVGGTD